MGPELTGSRQGVGATWTTVTGVVVAGYTWFSGTGSVSSDGLRIEASGTTPQGGFAYSFHAQ
jgi:hypothetical protein